MADVRRTLAEVLRDGDARPVDVVLADALRVADAAMQDVKAEVVERGERDGSVPVELVDRLLQMAGRASSLAQVLHSAGIAERLAAAATEQATADLTLAALDRMHRALQDGLQPPPDAFEAWWTEAAGMALLDLPLPPLPVLRLAHLDDAVNDVLAALDLQPHQRDWAREQVARHLAGEPIGPPPRPRLALEAARPVERPDLSRVPESQDPPVRPGAPDSGPAAPPSADAHGGDRDEDRWAALIGEMTGTGMDRRIGP